MTLSAARAAAGTRSGRRGRARSGPRRDATRRRPAPGSGVVPDAARRRASHHVLRSSSRSAATASLIRGAKSRADSSGTGLQRLAEAHRDAGAGRGSASPARAASRRRCRGGRPGRPARRAGPRGTPPRSGSGRPSRPGAGALGKITRLQPSASTSPGVVAMLPPRRSIGNVLNTRAEPDRAPPGVEEVVGGCGDRRTPSPLVGQRQQDQRGVEVGGVVGHEDHRRRRSARGRRDPRPGGCTWERNSGSRTPFCATSRAFAPVAGATSRSGRPWSGGGTNGSADRGTIDRRPQRQPTATVRTSSTPSLTKPISPDVRDQVRAGCAGR